MTKAASPHKNLRRIDLSLVDREITNKQRKHCVRVNFATVPPLSRVFYGGYTHFHGPLHLIDFLTPSSVAVPLSATGKDALLNELVALAAPDSPWRDAVLDEVRARETVFPTALGDGVAMPHVRSAHVTHIQMSAGVLSTPIPFGPSAGHASDLFFLLLSPAKAPSEHLNVLRALSQMLAQPTTVSALRRATSVAEFLATVRAMPSF